MSCRRTALAAALSLLTLGQSLTIVSTTAIATGAVLLSTQAAHAESADDYAKAGLEKLQSDDPKGAIVEYSKAIKINPQFARAYHDRGIAKVLLGDNKG
ncbi:tetratricopeptide repeat protein, partial [Prochlorococcus sp. MIT 0701]